MNGFRRWSSVGVAVALSGLCACQSLPAPNPADNSALDNLVTVSIEARDELRLLAKAKEAQMMEKLTAEQQAQKQQQALVVPAGFERRADFSYTGHPEKAAEALATMAGYSLKIQGRANPHVPYVRIVQHDVPLNEALKELGIQTGDTVRVELYPAARLMLFIYKSQAIQG